MNLLCLDTETTGIGENDRLVEVACQSPFGVILTSRFRPPVPISFEAMSTHFITNKAVDGLEQFIGSKLWQHIDSVSKENNAVMIAHNAKFDLEMLKREGIIFARYIDTLRVARHLIDSPSYALQYLRFSLDLDVGDVGAHDAKSDVIVLGALFDYLKNKIGNAEKSHDMIVEEMIQLSLTPVRLKTLNFGKYAGMMIDDILIKDRKYLNWLFDAESSKPMKEQNEDLVFTLSQVLR